MSWLVMEFIALLILPFWQEKSSKAKNGIALFILLGLSCRKQIYSIYQHVPVTGISTKNGDFGLIQLAG